MRPADKTAVFSGAGIGGEAPASLPWGFGLRDDVLELMYAGANESLGDQVTDEQLTDLVNSGRKLEVVLARLSGAAGIEAAGCLFSLRLRVPNEAHMLAALHLALGGSHVTLNFDIGIELAYELLTDGEAANTLPEPYRRAAAGWRALTPAGAPALRVVASHDDFDKWAADGTPPALLKVHGSLSRDQRYLVDVVVLDIDELGQLTPSRRAAIDSLGTARQLLITGYSGADPDVYRPVLAAAPPAVSSWCCYSLPHGSPVRQDLRFRRIALVTGAPAGLAETALRDLLGLPGTPSWPRQELPGPGYREHFGQWAREFRAGHVRDEIAVAWAWLLADGGDLDIAERMLAELAGRKSAGAGTLLRYAEVLYARARGDDRTRAEVVYRQIAADRRAELGIRLMCRLRSGDISRGRVIRDGQLAIPHLVKAYAQPLLVLAATRAGRRQQEAAADAYRALQHTTLRVLERAAAIAPRRSWPALAYLCRAARWPGRRGERLAANGNRRSLIRQHGLLLSAYACLLSGHPAPPVLQQDIESLRDAYRSANDLPGSGNLAAVLAVVAASRKDLSGARRLLEEARSDYTADRPDARPIAAGAALLAAIQRILDRQTR
jgi:hypothetical protein